jgi:hypothetical protein
MTLSMTSRTAGQKCRILNVILLLQIHSSGDLIFSRSPLHVENLIFRPHKIFRTPMTLETPFHLQRISLRNHGHLIDSTVAGRTADAFVHMNRVIEISEVRKIVDANPLQRLTRLETGANRFQVRTVGPDLFMTIHAHCGRGHARRRCSLDGCVAITAIDTIIANVMLMAELNRLLALDPLARVPSGASDFCRDPEGREQNEDRAVDRGTRQVIRTMAENLWHCRREGVRSF